MASRCCLVLIMCLAWSLGGLVSGAPPGAYLHPDLQIAGMPKSGTSQMYKLLSTHRDVRALRKEWCPNPKAEGLDGIEVYARNVTQTMQRLLQAPPRAQAGRGPIKVVSACINTDKSLGFYRWVVENSRLPLENAPKFIYLMRDPADLLWARFNFWTTNNDVEQHLPGRWTSTDNFRTPEYFHSMLQAEGRIVGSFNLTHDNLRSRYNLQALDGLIEAAGRSNVLVINSASLEEPHVDAFIKDFSLQTGLALGGFDQRVLKGRTNSGLNLASRGVGQTINGARRTGVYEVSGYRPMLPRSRAFIYARARGFCREVEAKYGVRFNDCLAV